LCFVLSGTKFGQQAIAIMTNISKVQTATPQNFRAIAALNIAAYCEYAKDLTDQAWITLQTTLSAVETVAGRAGFLIVQIEGELAGSVAYCPPGRSIYPIPSDWASILLLAVAPNYRGQGIGQKLVETCIQRAREDQAQIIGLFTNELMTTAHQLYQSQGFREDGEIPQRLGLRYWRYRLDLTSDNLNHYE
jgi:ribosomal protein S18 acetylase RimI-like enzyme